MNLNNERVVPANESSCRSFQLRSVIRSLRSDTCSNTPAQSSQDGASSKNAVAFGEDAPIRCWGNFPSFTLHARDQSCFHSVSGNCYLGCVWSFTGHLIKLRSPCAKWTASSSVFRRCREYAAYTGVSLESTNAMTDSFRNCTLALSAAMTK